jgi:hypothetical protein
MEDNLARFDFGICMAGWDGDKVYAAPKYKVDVENKTFTLAAPITRLNSTIRCCASRR